MKLTLPQVGQIWNWGESPEILKSIKCAYFDIKYDYFATEFLYNNNRSATPLRSVYRFMIDNKYRKGK